MIHGSFQTYSKNSHFRSDSQFIKLRHFKYILVPQVIPNE